ncbi:unnamed protein product [Spirodela intermedia]|uniref:Uncharacterized protein n=1 Tax=Spirodela intermedia TaxID=51605 RepID=A0A7I8KGM2_SPIIN|nr:unnamed protein product [Spirodela intermedia]
MEGSSSSTGFPPDLFISFHTQERNLFKRLVLELKMHHIMAMGVISFWMWLESVGHPTFIQRMASISIETILGLVVEAETCLAAILIDASDPLSVAARRDALALASEGSRSTVDLRYLNFFWEVASTGVTSILNSVCPRIFGDLFPITSSNSISHGPRGVNDGLIDNAVGEGNTTERGISGIGMVARGGILGPYDGESSRSPENRPRSCSTGVLIKSMRGGGLLDQSSHLEIQHHRDGNGSVWGHRGMFNLEGRRPPNMQDSEQQNYLQMLLDEGIGMVFQQNERDIGVGGAHAPPRNVTIVGCGRNRASVSANNSRNAASPLPPRSMMHQGSNLSQNARAWIPPERYVPRDERTLFITFSNGYPLGERDLFHFFNGTYGGVELIYIQQVEGEEYPLFARVVFVAQALCFIVMNGKEKMKFMIRGRHVWVRRYVPKRKRKGQGRKRFIEIK